VTDTPCGINAECTPLRRGKYQCKCIAGYRGNPHSSGPDKCRDENTLYLEELFGLNRCWGCKYVPAILGGFQKDSIRRVLDVGTGSCKMLRQLRKLGLEAVGVEAVSFPLEDKCEDLLNDGVVQKAQLDSLPFPDNSFDLVVAAHVLEYLPKDVVSSVMAEIHRVTRLRALVMVRLPDSTRPGLGATVHGVTADTVFPSGWWTEKLAANGLAAMQSRQKMVIAAYKMSKAQGASPQDGIFVVAKEPEPHSVPGRLVLEPLCLACDYMPLIYHIYNPPGGIGALVNLKLYRFGDVAVFSPTACNIIRGMEDTKPSSLKTYTGYQLDPFTMERDCPELVYSGVVTEAPPPAQSLSELADNSLDLVMLMYYLEAMTEQEAREVIREARRVSKRHVFALVMTCGQTTLLGTCDAHQHPWVQNIQPYTWWSKLFSSEGLQQDPLRHIFRERPCLPDETDKRHPDRPLCPPWFQHFRYEGERELKQSNIFALEKVADRPPLSAKPAMAELQSWPSKDEEAEPGMEPAPSQPPPPPTPAFDPRTMRLPATRNGRPPAPRAGTLAKSTGYSWKGVSQLTDREKDYAARLRMRNERREQQHRASAQLGKRPRPEGGAEGLQERLMVVAFFSTGPMSAANQLLSVGPRRGRRPFLCADPIVLVAVSARRTRRWKSRALRKSTGSAAQSALMRWSVQRRSHSAALTRSSLLKSSCRSTAFRVEAWRRTRRPSRWNGRLPSATRRSSSGLNGSGSSN